MKKTKILSKLVLLLTIFGITLLISSQTKAQKKEDVIEYLQQRFLTQNLPVLEIKIIQENPLHLQIVVQSIGDFILPEDSINLHKVDREVFIIAYQNGFYIDRYTRILQNNLGEQLYMRDQGAIEIQQAIINFSSNSISDDDITRRLSESINLALKGFSIESVITSINVDSSDGFQNLTLQFSTDTLEDAYRVFGFLHKYFIFPRDKFVSEINSEGGSIVTCTYKITDDAGNTLFFYFFDYQLQKGTWSASDNFKVDLSEGDPPPPPLEITTPDIVSTEEIAIPIPTETITPTP